MDGINLDAWYVCNLCKQKVYVRYDGKGFIQVEYSDQPKHWERHRCYDIDSEWHKRLEEMNKVFDEIRVVGNLTTKKELEAFLENRQRACRRDISITVRESSWLYEKSSL